MKSISIQHTLTGNGIVEPARNLEERLPVQFRPLVEVELAPFKPHHAIQNERKLRSPSALKHQPSDHVVIHNDLGDVRGDHPNQV